MGPRSRAKKRIKPNVLDSWMTRNPRETEEQRRRREVWERTPTEDTSYGDPNETFDQRHHKEYWED